MGFLDAMKNRLGANLKYVRLSYMTDPREIVPFCQGMTPQERTVVLKGIDSAFKWQPAAQLAQALYPALVHSNGGVSQEAKDLVMGGNVDAGVELMRIQSQPAMTPQFGMTPTQQAALSFAWVVLKALEQPF